MEDFYDLRNELRRQFCAQVKNSSTEEKFIECIDQTLKRNSKYDIKALEVILDLALSTIDELGYSDNGQDESNLQINTEVYQPTSYDADDEGADDTFIFPCHLTFDDCHPETLLDYHREHLKVSTRASCTQIVRHPKLCEFVVDFMFKSLQDKFSIKPSPKKCSQPDRNGSALEDDETMKSGGLYLDDECTDESKLAEKIQNSYLNSTVVLVKKLNKICMNEKKNCRILAKTNILNILFSNILSLMKRAPEAQNTFLEPILDFAFTIADYKITGNDLKQLFNIIKDEKAELKTVLKSFDRLLSHHYRILKNIQPFKSINFPAPSRTAEEIESNTYMSTFWHAKVRSKVIEFKRKQSRTLENALKKENEIDEISSERSRLADQITPSWLECSFMTPLSNISPLVQNGGVKFCCSMWISVCGDLLVVDEAKSKKIVEDKEFKLDWRALNGHWLRLTSKKRLARRYREKTSRRKNRTRRLSMKIKKRQAHDKEDEEREEIEEKTRKSQLDLNQPMQMNGRGFRIKSSIYSTSGIRASTLSSKESRANIGENLKVKQSPPKEFLSRRAREKELLIHIVSFAVDTLTIEIWLNVDNMKFCARACRVAREGQTNLLDQLTFSSHLEANGNWSHLMFCLEESNKDQSSTEKEMNLDVLVNGIHIDREKMKLVYAAHKSPLTNFACLLGCERSTFGYVWKLAQVNIYKNLPPEDIPLYLLGKGPDFWSFTNYRQQSTLNLPDLTQRSINNLMNPKMLDLYGLIDEERALNWLTQNISIVYVAHQPDYFLDYSPSLTTPSMMNSSADHELSNSAERFIQVNILNFSRFLRFNTNNGFGSALIEAGGIESVLVCFADVIRRAHETPMTHALAFSILLKMSQTNQHHMYKFLDELSGLKLAEFILVHPYCQVSKSMLDYYFDYCLMKIGKHSLIKSPKLVYHLMSCWRVWHKDIRVAKQFYRKLTRLVQRSDPSRLVSREDCHLESCYIAHNLRMMTNAGGIDLLMGILRECLVPLDDKLLHINLELVQLIVNLISLLIKHPPGLDVILDIMEYLLFLHPDPKAYVEAELDEKSFMHPLEIVNKERYSYDNTINPTSTPSTTASMSYGNSTENVNDYSSNDISRNCVSRVTSDGDLITSRENCISNECSKNLARMIKDYTNEPQGYKMKGLFNWENYNDMDTCHKGSYSDRFNKTSKIPIKHKCSSRNFAIAKIADVLALIVKRMLKDSPKILKDALSKPIIDTCKPIILANNEAPLVRENVLRLFLYCIRACYELNLESVLDKYEQESKGSSFKSCTPIKLMAGQLLKYPITAKMIQLCCGIAIGIPDLETFDNVETVRLDFEIETKDNNLQLNTLILLIQLTTRLQDSNELISALKFVHTYIRKLIELGEDEILNILIKNSLIKNLMKIYFNQVEEEVMQLEPQENITFEADEETNLANVLIELDKILIRIVRYFIQNLSTSEAIKSLKDILLHFDLMNTYVPLEFQYILREREIKILTAAFSYCELYERTARIKGANGVISNMFSSFFKSGDLHTYPNTILEDSDLHSYDDMSNKQSDHNSEGESQSMSDDEYQEMNGRDDELDDVEVSNGRKISQSSVIERLKATIGFAVDFIIVREPEIIPSPREREFINRTIVMLSRYIKDYKGLLKRRFKNPEQKCDWFLMLSKLGRQFQQNLSLLILYLLRRDESGIMDERKYYAVKLSEMFTVNQLLELIRDDNDDSSLKVLWVFVTDLIGFGVLSQNSEGSTSEMDEDMLGNDTEGYLRQLVDKIELELGFKTDNVRNGYSEHKRAKTESDSNSQLYTKFWIANLTKMLGDARERIESLKNGVQFVIGTNEIIEEDLNRMRDEALRITRDVVNEKHEQRKVYLEDLKQTKVYNYHVKQQWLSLIIGHTHERAIWYMSNHYPKSWELNPVEGPSRIRRRLRPCKLTLEPRFLRKLKKEKLDENQTRSDSVNSKNLESIQSSSMNYFNDNMMLDDWYKQYGPHPLCSMVINQEQSIDSKELRTRMFTTDKIHFNCDCSIIRPNEVCEGEISIASWCIHFIGQRTDNHQQTVSNHTTLQHLHSQHLPPTVDDSGYGAQANHASASSVAQPRVSSILSRRKRAFISTVVEDLWFDEIMEIWDRRYQLQDIGLEIFLTNNMTYLISFRSNQEREDFKQSLMQEQHKMINLQRINLNTSLKRVTQLWRDGRLTNFDYLTCLNKLAGRSFNDLMQYPVFPFVLSNYISETLDLNDESNFRQLKKPMAVQNTEKEASFISTFEASQSTSISIGCCGMTKPYHYGNHYSNSATVLHFLVRLPPFTQMLIQYQDNNFDQPDRTFHSIASTWQLITRDSNTDFKELIPEFFFLPEMFDNQENLELGRKQNNELVNDVKLPPWCPNSDSRLFTMIHRQALESCCVSENLHNWVDLIFGYKQTGKAAIEAINVFHPATYYGVIDLGSSTSSSSSSLPFSSTTISTKSSIFASLTNMNNQLSNGLGSSETSSSSKKTAILQQKRQLVDIERLALETMIKTYGQMPRQLFVQPVKQRLYNAYAPIINQTQSAQRLDPAEKIRRLEPLRQVKGLRWGSYVGSPDENDITAIKHKRISGDEVANQKGKIGFRDVRKSRQQVRYNLCLLPNGEVAVLKNNTSLMLDYRADRKSGSGYQLSLPSTRYSRRAGLSHIARMNLFSSMIISRQQFSFAEPVNYGANQLDSANVSPSSLVSLTSSRVKFSPDSLSLVSWSYIDGTIRIRHPALNTQKTSVPLVQADSIVDVMSTCASVPELNLLLVGYKSGAICAHIVSTVHATVPISQYSTPFGSSVSAAALSSSSAAPSAIHHLHTTSQTSTSDFAPLGSGKIVGSSFNGEPYSAMSLAGKTLQSVRSISKTTRWLYCHSNRINCMKINVSFGIVVTGSDDGTSVIWDLNSLTYVRNIDYKSSSLRQKWHDQEEIFEQDKTPSSQWSGYFNSPASDYLCTCCEISSGRPISRNSNHESAYFKDTKQSCICSCGISLIAISDTLGDIVTVKNINNRLAVAATDGDEMETETRTRSKSTVSIASDGSDSGLSSVVYVHTINGALVGFVDCHTQVTAVCYSNAPEGISINVIVVGLADGKIRLYSSWDLSRVKEFHVTGMGIPISSLLYTRDNQLLYVVFEDGQMVVLRNKKKASITIPKEWIT